MRIRHVAGATLSFMLAAASGAAMAQSANTVVTIADGTRIETTVLGLSNIRINITGGPQFSSNPAVINVTTLSPVGSEITYGGTVMIGGSTTPFNCRISLATNAVVGGDSICYPAFGGTSAPTTPVTPVVTPPTTTPTTPTTPTTTPTTPTVTTGDGTVTVSTPEVTITATQAEQTLISTAQLEGFVLAVLNDRVNAYGMQSFIGQRLQAMEMAFSRRGGGVAGTGAYLGRSAGEGDAGPGVWINANGSKLRDNRVGLGVDGHTYSAAAGVDLSRGSFTFGAFGGYGDTKLDGTNSAYRSDGWTLGGYARVAVTPLLRFTGTVGFSDQDVRFDRTIGALRSVGSTDRNQTFGSIAVDSQVALGPQVVAVPQASVLFSDSDTDAYRDSAGRLIPGSNSNFSIGQVGSTFYLTGGSVLPYFGASLNHQFNREGGADRTYGVLSAGVAAPVAPTLSVLAGVQTLVAKRGERETSFGLTFRKGF